MTRSVNIGSARSLEPLTSLDANQGDNRSQPLQLAPPDKVRMRHLPSEDPSDHDADDIDLMVRVSWGDAEAFGRVMERYWGRTFRYAMQLQGDSERAYDVAQEAFVRLWERRRDWEPSGSVGGWLLRTARNLVISEQRRWKVRMRWSSTAAQEDSTASTPLQDVERAELRIAIQQAVRELSPRRREVFTLFHLQHLSYREIGEILDIRPQTIANHLQAAVEELRMQLGAFISAPHPSGEPSEGAPDDTRR